MSYTARTIFNYIIENYDKLLGGYYPLSDSDKDKLIKLNQNINYYKLYSSLFHGLYHSQKVMLFAFILGKQHNLNEADMKIILDAAIYHDIGRSGETEDTIHGYSSALKLDKIFNEPFYKDDKNNFEILKAIVDFHSRDDKYLEQTFIDYDIDEIEHDRFYKLALILKDADALDRFRFSKNSPAFIDYKFLHDEKSRKLTDFSRHVNNAYRTCVDKLNFDKYYSIYHSDIKDNTCFHGIGWDFYKLESILENGIVSQYVGQQNNLMLSRNYNGNNSNMWISVVDSMDIAKGGDCLKTFIDGNITFYSFVGKYCDGIPKSKLSEAYDSGLPIDSGLYDDEKFVFGSIPINDIYSIILPKNSLNLLIKDLNYLNCSRNYEIVKSRVLSYLHYINNLCFINVDETIFEKYFKELEDTEREFSNLPNGVQIERKDNFFEKVDCIVLKINCILQEIINSCFKIYFNLDRDIYVEDIIMDIFERHNISYDKLDAEEIIYCINKSKIKN